MFPNKITLKTKLIIPILTITAILLLLGVILISSKFSQIVSLKNLNKQIELNSKITNIIHSLQKERGITSDFILNKKNDFKILLIKQREISDKYIKEFYNSLEGINSTQFKSDTKKIIFKLQQLDVVREQIDKGLIGVNGILKFYTIVNKSLLNVIVNISKNSFIPKITQNIIAYSSILYVKEFASLERVLGIKIVLKHQLTRKMLIQFTNYISMQNQYQEIFFKYGSKNLKDYYKQINKNQYFEDIKMMRYDILYKDLDKLQFDKSRWYKISSAKIDTYKKIGDYINKQIIVDIKQELKHINFIFYIVTGLTIASFIVFIFMIIAFLRLAREEQRLRVVMDKYIISSITDLKGNIIDVSEAFCKISGYTKSELIGKQHNIIRDPSMKKETFKELWSTIKQGKSWKGKVKNRKKDGSYYWVYSNIEPLYNAKGEKDAYISVRLDITQSEQLQEKIKYEEDKNKATQELMQQQSRLAQMGEMLSMIAHQWRQPLSAISASAGALYLKASRDKLNNQTAIELSSKITEFSKHLSSTIDDFRDFFKSNKSKSQTDFNTLLQSVLNIINISLEQKDIKLNVEVKSIIKFETFENELKQVILNLIKNAEDAVMENKIENPVINIVINNNKFTVSDNAGGIPKDILPKIFDPYFSTKTKKDGTGLGLYMSKIIIEEHCNGSLSVTNHNNGAHFTIELKKDIDEKL